MNARKARVHSSPSSVDGDINPRRRCVCVAEGLPRPGMAAARAPMDGSSVPDAAHTHLRRVRSSVPPNPTRSSILPSTQKQTAATFDADFLRRRNAHARIGSHHHSAHRRAPLRARGVAPGGTGRSVRTRFHPGRHPRFAARTRKTPRDADDADRAHRRRGDGGVGRDPRIPAREVRQGLGAAAGREPLPNSRPISSSCTSPKALRWQRSSPT